MYDQRAIGYNPPARLSVEENPRQVVKLIVYLAYVSQAHYKSFSASRAYAATPAAHRDVADDDNRAYRPDPATTY